MFELVVNRGVNYNNNEVLRIFIRLVEIGK